MSDKKFTKVNDSGARQSFATGSVRDLAEGKGRFDLIPPYPLQRLAEHYENGAGKYGDRNWEKGQPLMRYIDSALRHLIKGVLAGDQTEDHFSAAVWNIFSYTHTLNEIEAGRLPKELDNRPARMNPNASATGKEKTSSGREVDVEHWKKGGCPICGKNSRCGIGERSYAGGLTCWDCYDKIGEDLNEVNSILMKARS